MNGHYKHTALLALAALSLLLLFSGCSSKTETDTSLKGKNITVGIGTYAPFSYQDESGKQIGFDVDLIDALSKKLGFTYTLKVMEYDPMFISAQNGDIDMAAGQIFITDLRKQKMAFSDAYYDAGLRIVVNKDAGITSLDQLGEKNFAIEKGTAGGLYAMKGYPNAKFTAFPQQSAAYMEVEKGAADATVYDTPNVAYYLKTHPDSKLVVIGDEYQKAPCGYAFPLKSPYVDQINKGLQALQADGTLKKLNDKWVKVD